MLPSPSFTSLRSQAINEFNSLRSQAVRNSWLSKLFRRNNSPRSFVASAATGLNAKRLGGVQNIPVEKIVGTIQRTDDFDRDFHPLKAHLRERWVNAFLRLRTDEWQPILVHKVGESYFVKDGHHRVSVAKVVGMAFIDAVVWDHCSCESPRVACGQSNQVVMKYKQTEVCSANM